MAARKSCAPAEEVKYQHFSDTRKGIQPTPGRYGESTPRSLSSGDLSDIRKDIQADSQHKTAYLIYTLDD